MARQEIVLGTPPQGLGGDTPRVASMKINAMTKEIYENLPTATDPLPLTKGGTGGKTAPDARTNLGLGTGAVADVTTSNVDATPGRLLRVSDFGIGSKSAPYIDDLSAAVAGGQYRFDPATVGIPVAGYGVIHGGAYDIASRNFTKIITYMNTPKAFLAGSINGSAYQIAEFYTTANTTRAADGTLKAV